MEGILMIIAVVAAAAGGGHTLRYAGRRLAVSTATLVLAGLTGVISAAGNLDPGLLEALGRNREALLDGQWWRLVTPLLVQDGGWAGTVFNLVTLLVIGILAESLHGHRVLVAVYLLAGIGSEVAAYTVLPHQGFAGNSVADLGLVALCLVTSAATPRAPARALGVIGLLAGAVLLLTADLHGVGFTLGALCGAVLVARRRRGTPPLESG